MNVGAEGRDVRRSGGQQVAMNTQEIVVVDRTNAGKRVEFIEPFG